MNLRLTIVTSLLALSAIGASAGQMISDAKSGKELKQYDEPCPPDTLAWMRLRSSYTGESDFERGDNASGDAFYNGVEANGRIPVGIAWPSVECGQWYFRYGAEYNRWDFNNDGGLPIPNTLQSFAAILAMEYVVRNETIALLEVRPGFFFEHDLDLQDFDIGVLAYAPLYNTRGDDWSFTIIGGASYRGFRSVPILPVLGFVYRTGKWTVFAVPPEPRLMYQATDRLTLWTGAELTGGSFRVDDADFQKKRNINEAVVTYSEYRAGAGFSYKFPHLTVDVGGGYAFQRKFDFHRAEEGFETDEGALYGKIELRAAF